MTRWALNSARNASQSSSDRSLTVFAPRRASVGDSMRVFRIAQ